MIKITEHGLKINIKLLTSQKLLNFKNQRFEVTNDLLISRVHSFRRSLRLLATFGSA
jgi:hypothetical protein